MLRNVGAKNHRPRGVPDGWGRQPEQLAKAREIAKEKAEQKVKDMIDQGILEQPKKIGSIKKLIDPKTF